MQKHSVEISIHNKNTLKLPLLLRPRSEVERKRDEDPGVHLNEKQSQTWPSGAGSAFKPFRLSFVRGSRTGGKASSLPIYKGNLLNLFRLTLILLLMASANTPSLQATGNRSFRLFEAAQKPAALGEITNWCYQLQKVHPYKVHNSKCDLIVIDFYKNSSTGQRFTPSEIIFMKTKPDGGRRILLSYISIGEAENYRPYWKPEWKQSPPKWLLDENPYWKGNFLVDYRHKDWQTIINTYVKHIQETGFDGIYLDKIDAAHDAYRLKAFSDIASSSTKLKRIYEDTMLTYCLDLFRSIKSKTPAFLIVPQNGEFLSYSSEYMSLTDGFGVEDLVYGGFKYGHPTPDAERQRRVSLLSPLKRAGKTILTVDYVTGIKAKESVAFSKKYGFTPYISTRALSELSPPVRG